MEIELEVLRFKDMVKRSDIKRPTWFAVDNDIFTHPDFFNIAGDEFKVWIWICSVASKINCSKIRLDSLICAHQLRVDESVFFSTIEKLKGKRISVRKRTGDFKLHVPTLQTLQTLQDKQNTTEQDTTHTTGPVVISSQQAGHANENAADADPPRVSKAASRGCVDEFFHDEICQEFLSQVTHRAQKSWLQAYPSVDWIVHEIRKAHAWCETNPHKAPKDKGKFMLNWLSRAFETYRKGLQSKPMTNADRVQANNDAIREKIRRGEM